MKQKLLLLGVLGFCVSLMGCKFIENANTPQPEIVETNEVAETNEIVKTNEVAETNEIVSLTTENYKKYITTYKRVIPFESSSSIYYEFEGSSLCKFEDVVITYCFSHDDNVPEDATFYTCELNLSGCGQCKVATASQYSSRTKLIIVDIQGTVEILV